MTIAAALFFDNSVFTQSRISNGACPHHRRRSGSASDLFNPNGHNLFVLAIIVLVVCVIGVLLIRNGHHRPVPVGHAGQRDGGGRARHQPHLAAGADLRPLRGGGRHRRDPARHPATERQHRASSTIELGLAFVVIVVTTGVSTVEGAIQGGMGFVVIQQLLTYLPARFGGNSLTFVLFAFGALTYAAHPEGILEFQKRRWTLRFERLLFSDRSVQPGHRLPGPPTSARDGPAGAHRRSAVR